MNVVVTDADGRPIAFAPADPDALLDLSAYLEAIAALMATCATCK